MSAPLHPRIRVIAIGLLLRRGKVLVSEGRDPVEKRSFFRPLGGAVNFGEAGAQALAREIREEIYSEIRDVRYIGTLENFFTWMGNPMHEIVLVYDASFVEERLYHQPVLEGRESDGTAIRASWHEIEHLKEDGRLVPSGLGALLDATVAREVVQDPVRGAQGAAWGRQA